MAILLSIETATHACSVALHEDGKLLASSELHITQTAGSKLAVLIDHLMAISNLKPNQINGVAISSGPGSYTGLRIGIATAKGLCFALGVPLISIKTLELMAFQIKAISQNVTKNEKILLCPMLDARRMEVYALLMDNELNIVKPTEAIVIDGQSFAAELNGAEVWFFGNGAEKCRGVINNPNALFISGITPSAAMMGELAFDKWQKQQVEDLVTFEPFYLKDFMIRKPKSV